MSSPTNTWSDRRGMFQRGKDVHEPARRPSEGASAVADAVRRASVASVDKTEKTGSGAGAGSSPSAAQRRRSSAASGGLFGNLTNMKRGSEDHAARQASHHDQIGQGGMMSGWWNSTFRGHTAGPAGDGGASGEQKK